MVRNERDTGGRGINQLRVPHTCNVETYPEIALTELKLIKERVRCLWIFPLIFSTLLDSYNYHSVSSVVTSKQYIYLSADLVL